MTTPRRADARRGFLFASIRFPRLSWQGWQGGTRCGTLDSMIQYNRPRRRGEVADFSAASGRRLYVFAVVRLALCSRLPISSGISSAQARAPADAGQAQRMQRMQRARASRGRAQGRGFTSRRCARGLGGAYDIGRDGTSSGGRGQAHGGADGGGADALTGVLI